MDKGERIPGSFRDPSGFLFRRDGVLYRQVNLSYRENYRRLLDSGLYGKLVGDGLLVPHEESGVEALAPEESFLVIRPEEVPFISYPYEWCFSQLKSAALATLEIEKRSLEHGMSLKDCSAYNIQFWGGKPVFIDTLSFEEYREDRPWVAYRQFCQHFLAPLALLRHGDGRLGRLSGIFLDGVPLDLASSLLPARTRISPALAMHLHLHAKAQKRFADGKVPGEEENKRRAGVSRLSLLGLIDSLESAVEKMAWGETDTEWGDYYEGTNYSADAFSEKKRLVSRMIESAGPETVWDAGANDGTFSRAAGKDRLVISMDADPVAVEKNYRQCVSGGEKNILPLIIDLANPSPAAGWQNRERMSLLERGPADLVLALALVHHLAISNNLPFEKIADFFRAAGDYLIIEFVPKNDSQVKKLLAGREDIFTAYDRQSFEKEFSKKFSILEKSPVKGSERTLYLMKRL